MDKDRLDKWDMYYTDTVRCKKCKKPVGWGNGMCHCYNGRKKKKK